MTVRLIAGIAGLTLAGVTAPAQAAAPPGEHCVQHLQTGTMECFSSLNTALVRAKSTKAAGEVIQGTFFDNRDFGGDSWTVVGAGLCDGSDGVINYQTNTIDGWADRISSVQPWANCKIWLYPEPDLKGDRDGPFTQNTGWVGSMMDDRTKSVGFN